jgi:hypothetical protein
MSDRQRFTPSSQRYPCPVCGRTKDGDCRVSEDSRFVLCHSEINSRQPREEFNGFIWLGEDSAGNWGKWIAVAEDWQKIRPQGQEFRYPFCDRQGNQLVEEVRVYQPGGGKKQWMEPKGTDTSKLVPYRYAEAHKALKEGAEHCFIVEGPPKADYLWSLGLPAVAFANGFRANRDSHWFVGYENRLIIAADLDQPGVTKAERVQMAYPMARLLKPWPDSCWWEPEWLPKKNGKDIKDWVEQLQGQGLSSSEIRDRILGAVESEQAKLEKPEPDCLIIQPEPDRPIIQLEPGKIAWTLREIEEYLGQGNNPIYLQGNSDGCYLSRVLSLGSDQRQQHIEVSPDAPTLDLLNTESLRYELNNRLGFERYDGRTQQYKPCNCPRDLAAQFLAMGSYPKLPLLTGISSIPLLLKNGEVVTQPGYHSDSGILLQFDPDEFPAIPEHCTVSDAIAALAILRDWLSEFPFQTPAHESAALSAVLTAVCRRLLPQAPLQAFSATKAGTGKGTLARGISTLLIGGHPGAIPYTGDSEEFRKKITSFLKSGQSIGLIDNVTGILGGDVLEMVLTEPFFKDRLLGGNQEPSFSTQVTLLANGNNLRFRPDMTRRTILVVLDRETENPELH